MLFRSAKELGQLIFLKDLVIEHLHFRQGKSNIDETYSTVQKANADLSPIRTYKLLDREKRIDQFLIASALGLKMPFNRKYFYSFLKGSLFRKEKVTSKEIILKNTEIIGVIVRKLLQLFK